MSKIKKIFTESGFSLVELMVGVALLGGASLALMNVEKLSSSVKKTSLYALDSARIIKGVSTILNDGTSCAETFKDVDPAGAGATVDDIIWYNRASDTSSNKYSKGEKYGNESLRLKEIRIRDWTKFQAETNGIAKVQLTFEKVDQYAMGIKEFARSFNILVDLDAPNGVIKGCFTMVDAVVESACELMGGTWDRQIADGDPATDGICRTITTQGSLTFEDSLTVGNNVVVTGAMTSSGQVQAKVLNQAANIQINGSLISAGAIDAGTNTRVLGNIYTDTANSTGGGAACTYNNAGGLKGCRRPAGSTTICNFPTHFSRGVNNLGNLICVPIP